MKVLFLSKERNTNDFYSDNFIKYKLLIYFMDKKGRIAILFMRKKLERV